MNKAAPKARRNEDLQVVQVRVDELVPDPGNPRRIADEELEALCRSIKEYGFVEPVLARRETRVVIGGHHACWRRDASASRRCR